MRDSDSNGGNSHGSTMERVAESTALKLVARWMMAVGLPVIGTAIIGAGSWFANRVISATDENTKATIELKQSFKSLVEVQIPGLSNLINSRIDGHAQRLDAIDRRNDQQDSKIDELQRRVWRLPEQSPAATPSHPPATPSIRPYPNP